MFQDFVRQSMNSTIGMGVLAFAMHGRRRAMAEKGILKTHSEPEDKSGKGAYSSRFQPRQRLVAVVG